MVSQGTSLVAKCTSQAHLPLLRLFIQMEKKTVEVDIEKDSGSIVKIEEEVDLDSIPANIVEKAKSSGVDLATCQIYQAAKSSSGELEGYEFDDCELSKKDVDVDVDTLDVDVESNDSTTRDS